MWPFQLFVFPEPKTNTPHLFMLMVSLFPTNHLVTESTSFMYRKVFQIACSDYGSIICEHGYVAVANNGIEVTDED